MKKLVNLFHKKISEINEIRNELRAKKNNKGAKKTKKAGKTSELVHQVEVDIPTIIIVKVLFVVAVFLALTEIFVQLQSILTISAVCFFLAIGITPIIKILEQKMARPIAILILYLLFLGGLTILFFAILPLLIEQLNPILEGVGEYFGGDMQEAGFLREIAAVDTHQLQGLITGNVSEIFSKLQVLLGSTFSILSGVFQGLFNFTFALVLLFFILLEREILAKAFLSLFSEKKRIFIQQKTERVQEKMLAWFRGQVILMISIGIFMYLGMKIFEYTLGMQYAGTIALVAAFMELFPYIGVTITGVLALLVAVNISWALVIAVIAWIALTQFLEGNFLVPIVMEKVTGLSSVTVMLALAIGGVLGNAVGGIPVAILFMILAIPVAASLAIFIEEYTKRRGEHLE